MPARLAPGVPTLDFTITAPAPLPAIPTVTGPVGSTTNTTPAITWSAAANAARYELWVNNVTTGQTQVIWLTNLTTTSYTPTTPLVADTYRVWVRAYNGAGQTSPWSATLDFTITAPAPLPAIPTVTGPVGSTTNTTPAITWSAAANAARYELWVNNVTTGQTQVIWLTNLTTTSYTPTTPLAADTYRVWVRAYNSAGQTSPWSATLDFTITAITLPNEPLLHSSDLQYVGAFRVPAVADPLQPGSYTYSYGGTALAYNPADNGLYLVGMPYDQAISELSIPQSIVNSSNLSDLSTATVLQQPVQVLNKTPQ